MTTTPKASRFRLGLNRAQKPSAAPANPKPAPQPPAEPAAAEEYSARQLRIARRVAEKNGIKFSNDLDAIAKLKNAGIDPFDRGTIMNMVTPERGEQQTQKAQLPQRIEPVQVPAEQKQSGEVSPVQQRETEIHQIQRDMIRRRRRNTFMLTLRLLAFVFLPTAFVSYYYYAVATPMYATNSAFSIIKGDGGAGGGSMGGLLAGTQFATSQDAVAVQTFLQSKEAMLRLDKEHNFIDHFAQDNIDFVQKLAPDASIEDAYRIYKRMVKIGFDPTEGVIRLEVIAADPDISQKFNNALITYAEARVDNLSQRKRENQVADARRLYQEAIVERERVQEDLVKLQQSTLLDPEAYAASLRSQITTLEAELLDKELELQAFLDNARPNASRVSGTESDIKRLKTAIEEIEARMKAPLDSGMSLAELVARIQIATADLATRDLMLQGSLEQLRMAETEATSQSRYLSRAGNPVAPQDATYPRAFENTLLAFAIFAGIYLMISITASILREQLA